MIRAAITTAAVLALLLAGSIGATLAPNVRGTVPASDTTAANCPSDEPCDPPIGSFATYVMFSRAGHPTVRVRAVDGSFSVHLVPGRYTIALSPPPAGTVSPAAIRVPSTGVVRLHVVVQPTP